MAASSLRPGSPSATAVFVWLLCVAGCSPESARRDDTTDRPRTTGVATPPLKPGDTLPPLEAPGWINGTPPAFGSPGVKLFVVDVWSRWCPLCKSSAPGLVRTHRKYADKGVAFVSVTNMPMEMVEAYVKETGATWPNAYEITAGMVARLGAGSGMMGPPEYEVAPTLYVAGPEGKVRWVDDRGRYRHVSPEKWEESLDDAIEAALATPGKKP